MSLRDLDRVLDALDALEPGVEGLRAASRLRELLPVELARRAGELTELRGRARRKLESAERLVLTRRGLEQATHRRVARARAEHIQATLPDARVVDATAGIGGDSLALAAAGLRLVAADNCPETARALRHNLLACGRTARVVVADAARPAWARGAVEVLVMDPDRRAGVPRERRARVGNPEAWAPPLSRSLALAAEARGAALKLPPALDGAQLERRIEGLPHRLQWVSLDGELKELVLWTGALAEGSSREALVLASGGAQAALRGAVTPIVPRTGAAAESPRWIAEPDPAVIGAGLVGHLARTLDLAPLAPGLAYLGGDQQPDSPFLRSWKVLGDAPLDRRRVRALLAQHDVGRVSVKKRGFPEAAESLARRLRGSGSRRGLLLAARLESGHRAWLVDASR